MPNLNLLLISLFYPGILDNSFPFEPADFRRLEASFHFNNLYFVAFTAASCFISEFPLRTSLFPASLIQILLNLTELKI